MRLLLLALLAAVLVCLHGTYASSDQQNDLKPKSSETVRHLATTTVLMNDDSFDKADVTINVGDSITWVQNGDHKHNATADDGSWTTGDLTMKGQSATLTFNQATGDTPISYNCTHHKSKGMTGKITVKAKASKR
jgi:plastocyanin